MTEFRPGRFEILPTVIKNLLVLNILFLLAQNTVGAGDNFNMTDLLALHHVKSPLFQPWQLITHMFMHANMWHLIGNMFALWTFGSVLENVWGPKKFLTFYFLCGIGAALIHLTYLWIDTHAMLNEFAHLKSDPTRNSLLSFLQEYGSRFKNLYRLTGGEDVYNNLYNNPTNPQAFQSALEYVSDFTNLKVNIPTVGASGAVYGVIAAFVYLYPNTTIYLNFLFPIKTKWLALVYFVPSLYTALVNDDGNNVAEWAHLGGGLVGFLLVLTWNKNKRRRTLY